MMDIFSAHYGSSEIIKHSDKPHDTAKCYSIKNYKGTFGVISSVTNPFCSTCNRIRLTADGKMKNCLFSNNETDLLSPLRQELNITTLIINSILSKKAERGGMKQFDKIPNTSEITKNRSMVSIGG
jgi:cyclic pyranopterin phosphate synthase